jgi:hypothetical protein
MLHITPVYHNTATPNWRWPVFSKPAHVKKQFIFRRYKKFFDDYYWDAVFFREKRNKDSDYYPYGLKIPAIPEWLRLTGPSAAKLTVPPTTTSFTRAITVSLIASSDSEAFNPAFCHQVQ